MTIRRETNKDFPDAINKAIANAEVTPMKKLKRINVELTLQDKDHGPVIGDFQLLVTLKLVNGPNVADIPVRIQCLDGKLGAEL
jgi:hypothetical protein